MAAGFETIHYLENDSVEIDGVVFLGCPLWTDCELWQTGLYAYPETLLELQECLGN